MAIGVDLRQSGTSSAGATTLSWSHTVTTGNILIVAGGEASGIGDAISGINWDDGGTPQALTVKGTKVDSTAHGWAEIWYRLAPSVGTKTIKVTYTGTVACTTGSASYSGVDQTTPFNAASPQSALGTASPATVNITSAVGELVVDSVNDNEAAVDTLVLGAGQTVIYNIENAGNNSAASSDEAGAASVTMSWTGLNAASVWAIVGVSLKPASSGIVVGSTGTRRVGNARGPYDRRGFINRAVWETLIVAAVAGAVTLTPDTGLLQLDGFAPTFPTTVAPSTGQLTLNGNAPTFPVLVVPGSGALSLSGFAPTIGVPKTIVPGLGSLVLTGAAPTFPTTLLPGSGALLLSGLAPTIGTPVTVVAGFGQLTLSGLAPTFPRTILPGAGALTLSGFSPTFPYTLRPGLGSLVLDGFAGSFGPLGSITLQPGFGALSLTGFAPTIGVPVTVVPGLGALSLSGQAPTFPRTITIGFGQLTLTGFDPAFTFTPLFLSRAIAHSDGTIALSTGLSRSITVAQNTGTILIYASDSKTIALGTTQNATVSLETSD